MGYFLSKILSAVGVASTMPFALPQNTAPTRSIGGLEGNIEICLKGGVKLCQTNLTHYLWDGELYDDSGKKIILNKDGAPIASGRWSYRGLENHANTCFMEGVKECYTNSTHYLLNNELFLVNPDGALVKAPHPSEQPPKDKASSNKKLLKEGLKGNVVICEKPPGVQRCEINGSHYLLDDALHIIDPKDPTKARLIHDAPAKQPFKYHPVEVGKFLTCFTNVAVGTVVGYGYLRVHANRINNQVLFSSLLLTLAVAQLLNLPVVKATGSQPNPSNLPKKILTNPNPNFIKPLSPPKNLSGLSSPPLDRV